MSTERQIPYKRLMIIIGIVLMLLLMVFANNTESAPEAKYGAAGGASTRLEKDLPKEERIPTH